jgi:hypothetical protein
MPKSYAELMAGLKKETIDVPYDEIPEELGAFREPPQPGSFRFQIPPKIQDCFDLIEVERRDAEGKVVVGTDGKALTYQRIQLIFDGPNALTIVQSPRGAYDNEPFNTRISNIERSRFVSKDVRVKVADLTYLLRAKAPDARPRTNEEFITVALQTLPGQAFGADIEWNGFCNPKNDAVFAFPGEGGETVYEPALDDATNQAKKGCGERVYMNKWPREKGVYAARAQCKCGAVLRPFAQLVRFKP